MLSAGTAPSDTLEFRSYDDDAWYDVQLKLEDDVLRVRYSKFSEEHDTVFNAGDFQSFSEVDALEDRFRPLSLQLQDSECRKVDPGMAVCASFSSRHDDVRFYDALVEGHGPNSGNLSIASIANMCRIQSRPLDDAVLATFFRKVRDKIKIQLSKGDSCSGDQYLTYNCDTFHEENRELSSFQHSHQETRSPKHSLSRIQPYQDQRTLSKVIEQDSIFGGMKYQYMILLENVDKGLSPLRLAKFLQAQTDIFPRVYIFPSLSSEPYARGVIVLNCIKNLEKLYDFLDNPDHVIVSSRGRPLVVTGKISSHDTFGDLAGAIVLNADNNIWTQNHAGACTELKVHGQGTKEYTIGKQMKELFMDFVSHQRRLHQRLAMEESKIYCGDPLQHKMLMP